MVFLEIRRGHVAYKNIDDVVEAADKAGISKRILRLVPIENIKG